MKTEKRNTRRARLALAAATVFIIAVCALSTRAQGTPHGGRATVRVRTETALAADTFALGDIADVRADDEAILAPLRSVSLGYAPQVGVVRELPRERIETALLAAGFDPPAVRLDAPALVRLTRLSQKVEPALIRERVEQAILARVREEGATARLVSLDLPSTIEVAAGDLDVRAGVGFIRDFTLPFAAGVELRVAGRVARRLSLNAQADVTLPVLVARRDLEAGARLTADDVIVESRPLRLRAGDYLRDATLLRGRATRRFIPRGGALTADAVVAPVVVKPGDAVRIEGVAAGVRVTVAGEARGAGRVGDRVRVRNTSSNQMLQATIVDEGVVEVRY